MANDDLLMDDELAQAFFSENSAEEVLKSGIEPKEEDTEDSGEDWVAEDVPGQLAVDVYETVDKLVVKARTAGISKSDLNVQISDNILTISGILSGGEDEQATQWHIQECYWGQFQRAIALPVAVQNEPDSVKAVLKDGVLTITFNKEKVVQPTIVTIE